ncbi:hypothetical protein EYC84_001555 [Monilinia fructicola]|uniref:Uncharacterized protein n=1 Tax=Monilinia fructicola TaxID=38448 RepID=A0A5M9JS83_MONFR|nr:hypothetical protein EYC84_001555 [Monilinia fructicola]
MSLSFLLHHSTCAVRLQLESTTWIGTGTGTGTGTETETGRRRKGLFIPYDRSRALLHLGHLGAEAEVLSIMKTTVD